MKELYSQVKTRGQIKEIVTKQPQIKPMVDQLLNQEYSQHSRAPAPSQQGRSPVRSDDALSQISVTSRSVSREAQSNVRMLQVHKAQIQQSRRFDSVMSQARVSARTTSNVTPVNQQRHLSQTLRGNRDLKHIHISCPKKTPQILAQGTPMIPRQVGIAEKVCSQISSVSQGMQTRHKAQAFSQKPSQQKRQPPQT